MDQAVYSWNNCPKEIKKQILALSDGIASILQDTLIGIYLHGSLAVGCFNPSRSDIDILVIQANKSSIARKCQFANLLLSFSHSPAPIEISFLSADQINPWRFPTPYDFHFSEDHRERVKSDLTSGQWRQWNKQEKVDGDLAAHITVLKERGICICGQPIADVFPRVPRDDFLSSILSDFRWIRDHVVESPVYSVLNMCRVLAYTREGKNLSKKEAAEWALKIIPKMHTRLVRTALNVYSGDAGQELFEEEELISFAAFVDREVMAA